MLEKLSSRQLMEIIGDLLDEIRSRDDIFIANNGNVYLKECEDCGSPIEVASFKFTGTDDEMAFILNNPDLGESPYKRWKRFIEYECERGRISLPCRGDGYVIPPHETGEWFIAYCDCIFGGPLYYGEWQRTYDDAVSAYTGMPVYTLCESFNLRKRDRKGGADEGL